MRTAELLDALSQTEPGLLCLVGPQRSSIETLYEPKVRCSSPSLFEAALLVAAALLPHSDCPPDVKAALDEYEHRTACDH